MPPPTPVGAARGWAAVGAWRGGAGREDLCARRVGVFPHNESYDARTGAWVRDADLPTPRHGMAAAAVGDTIYVPGGGPVTRLNPAATNAVFSGLGRGGR
ncbi:hypothetical protein GCM10009534_74810 [Kribbella sandramycini]